MKQSHTDRDIPRPRVTALELGDSAHLWEPLGFVVQDGAVELGGVRVALGAPSKGISAWTLHAIPPTNDIDGLPTRTELTLPQPTSVPHPNRATGVDHVVVSTPNFDRTARVLAENGMPLRRITDAGGVRQGFRRLGPAILELVEAQGADLAGPARFWGLVVIVDDLDRLKERLGDLLGDPKPAVQPGRHIATLRKAAGLGQPVAFMDPEPGTA